MAGHSKPILALAGPKNEDSHATILLLSAVNGMEGNREAAFTTRISCFGNLTVSGEKPDNSLLAIALHP